MKTAEQYEAEIEELKRSKRPPWGYILLGLLVVFICWNEERKAENIHRRTMELHGR